MILKLENFVLKRESKTLLKSISLELDLSQLLFLIGNNGAGKSSFFYALQQKINFEGDVLISGLDIEHQKIVYLGQTNTFFFPMTVRDFIRIDRENDRGEEFFNFILHSLKIESWLDDKITQLSQGQIQLVLIAQTLIQQSDLVLLDEPDNFLDIRAKNLLFQTLKAVKKEWKISILISSHHLEWIQQFEGGLLSFFDQKLELNPINSDSISKIKGQLIA